MRREIELRPLAIVAGGLILGLACMQHYWVLAVLVAGLVFLSQLSSRITLASAFLLGVILGPAAPALIRNTIGVSGIGTVCAIPKESTFGWSVPVSLDGLRLQTYMPTDSLVSYGDKVSLEGTAEPFRSEVEGSRREAGFSANFRGKETVVGRGPWIFGAAARFRTFVRSQLESNMEPTEADVAAGLLFGAQAIRGKAASEAFQDAGVIQILSASGLNVIVFGALLQWVLTLVPIPRTWQLGVLIALIAFLCVASGLRPAIVRGSVTYAAASLAYVWRRQPDWISAVCLSAVLYLLWDPWGIYEPGFQISFAAIVGLSVFRSEPKVEVKDFWDRLGIRAWTASRFLVVGFLATLPLVAYHFGSVPLLGTFAGLLVAPVVPVIMAGDLLALIFGSFLPFLGAGILKVSVEPLSAYSVWITDRFASVPFASIKVAPFSGLWVVAYYVAFFSWPIARRALVRKVSASGLNRKR